MLQAGDAIKREITQLLGDRIIKDLYEFITVGTVGRAEIKNEDYSGVQ